MNAWILGLFCLGSFVFLVMLIGMYTTVNLSLTFFFKVFSLFCLDTFCVFNTSEILHGAKFYTTCMFTNIGIILFSSLVAASIKMCYCAKVATLYECA